MRRFSHPAGKPTAQDLASVRSARRAYVKLTGSVAGLQVSLHRLQRYVLVALAITVLLVLGVALLVVLSRAGSAVPLARPATIVLGSLLLFSMTAALTVGFSATFNRGRFSAFGVAVGALAFAGLAAGLAALISGKLAVTFSWGEQPCPSCAGNQVAPVDLTLRLETVDLQLDCRHRVGTFKVLEPPSPRLDRSPLLTTPSIADRDPIEGGNGQRRITELIDALRGNAGGRTLAGIVILGSSDPRRVLPGLTNNGHRDNAGLAMARAEWVEQQLIKRFEHYLAPPRVLVAGGNTARLVLSQRDQPVPMPARETGDREVFVCGLWQTRGNRPSGR